jgi:hypothetical protein
MSDETISPMDILAEAYKDTTLPQAQPIDGALKKRVSTEIKAMNDKYREEGKARLARFIYDILY